MKENCASPSQPPFENNSNSSLTSSASVGLAGTGGGVGMPIANGAINMIQPHVGIASTSAGVGYTQEQLWELLKNKEAVTHTLQQKLTHYRMWMASIHARVQQMSPNVIKNARRLYVGGLDEGFEDEDLLKSTLSEFMMNRGGCTNPGNPILSCKITPEKGYAFIELRSVEEATNVLAFDGIAFQDSHLKIRRPSNYDPAAALMLGPTNPDPTVDNSSLDICRSVVEDSPNKLFVGGLPCDWSEDQVKDLLLPLGCLKSFNLVMDKVTGKSKGYAFCQFEEGQTDYVVAALNQKKVGNKVLTVKRALEGQKQLNADMLMPNGNQMQGELQGSQSMPSPNNQLQPSASANLMASMFSGMQFENNNNCTENNSNHNNNNQFRSNSMSSDLPQQNQPRQNRNYSQTNGMMLKQDAQMHGGMQKQLSNNNQVADITGVPNMQYSMGNGGNPSHFGLGGNSGMW